MWAKLREFPKQLYTTGTSAAAPILPMGEASVGELESERSRKLFTPNPSTHITDDETEDLSKVGGGGGRHQAQASWLSPMILL